MEKFARFYDEIEAKVLVASLAFTVAIIFFQIIMRSVFNSSLSWSEELARYIFIWQIWLGMSVGLRDNKHIRVELIFNFIKGRGANTLNIISSLLCIILCAFLFYYGGKIVLNAMNKNTLSAAMRMPLWIVYLSLPFSCLVTGLRYVYQLYTQLKNFNVIQVQEGD